LFLSRLAANDIGAEGAGRLAEPLGKLTALQELDLAGAILSWLIFLMIESDLAWDGAFGLILCLCLCLC
jgi:hypothetical protein